MTAHLKKAELHCHIEGATPPDLALRQARQIRVDTSAIIRDGLCLEIHQLVRCYDAVASLFRTRATIASRRDYWTELAEAGTIYSEIIVSPDHGERSGSAPTPISRPRRRHGGGEGEDRHRIAHADHRHPPISVPTRSSGPPEYAAMRRHPLVTGFNLAGEERMHSVAEFSRAFDTVRDAGLGLTIHAGELFRRLQRARCAGPCPPGPDQPRGQGDRGRRSREAPCRRGRRASKSVPDRMSRFRCSRILPRIPLGGFTKRRPRDAQFDDPPFFHTSLAQEYEIGLPRDGLLRQRDRPD